MSIAQTDIRPIPANSRRYEPGAEVPIRVASFRTRSSITSTGTATGTAGAQFEALKIPFRPDFAYRAQVQVQMPQASLLSATWQKSPVLRISLQATWTNWKHSFADLPVSLTNGTNPDINNLLQTNAIKDLIPLNWKDQWSIRGAIERQLGESFSVSGGYLHQNSPVPSSTLSPLTAAIMRDGLTAGAGCRRGRTRFDVAYQLSLTSEQSVGVSALLSGEFDHSRVRLGTQAVIVGMTFRPVF